MKKLAISILLLSVLYYYYSQQPFKIDEDDWWWADIDNILLRDVDFDGENELVVRKKNEGQRFADAYDIYEKDESGKFVNNDGSYLNKNKLTAPPFNDIDSLTTFNPADKTIVVYGSGGSCHNSERVYKKFDNLFKLISVTKWREEVDKGDYVCIRYLYDMINGKEVLKSKHTVKDY